jgi:hypothetical protein
MSETALTVTNGNDFDTLQRQATALQQSGYFEVTQAQAITKVLAGAELGLPPFASIAGIHVIQGKPSLSANLIATLVDNDPRYNYNVVQHDSAACVIEWHRNGQKVGIAGFTMAEAKTAGLAGKDNWKKYPSDMLFARSISRGARRFAPGIFGGSPIYTPDELGADVDEEGNVIEGELVTGSDNGQEDETIAEVTEALDTEQDPPPPSIAKGNGKKGKKGKNGTWDGKFIQDIAKKVKRYNNNNSYVVQVANKLGLTPDDDPKLVEDCVTRYAKFRDENHSAKESRAQVVKEYRLDEASKEAA